MPLERCPFLRFDAPHRWADVQASRAQAHVGGAACAEGAVASALEAQPCGAAGERDGLSAANAGEAREILCASTFDAQHRRQNDTVVRSTRRREIPAQPFGEPDQASIVVVT